MIALPGSGEQLLTSAWHNSLALTQAQAHITWTPLAQSHVHMHSNKLAWQCAGAQAHLAFFPFGTIAHALTEDDALAWLRDASACLAPGGLIVLQMEHPGGIFDGAMFEVRLLAQLQMPLPCSLCGCMLLRGLHREYPSVRCCNMSMNCCMLSSMYAQE